MRIAIAGASGRMGRMLIEAVLNAADAQLAVALDVPGSPSLGRDAGEFLGKKTDVLITDDVQALANADVLIDFTRPEGTLNHLQVCVQHGVKCVIGTTGFDAAGKQAIADAAQRVGVVFSPNMNVGVNVTLKLLEVAARFLGATDYDIEITEAHHRHKVDAPSGTALKMGEVIAKELGFELDDQAVLARVGHTGERERGSIGFSVIRGGDIIGDHTVLFAGAGERIEISHKSTSRAGYAQGSLRACRYVMSQSSGLFGMDDVLGLK